MKFYNAHNLLKISNYPIKKIQNSAESADLFPCSFLIGAQEPHKLSEEEAWVLRATRLNLSNYINAPYRVNNVRII